MTVLIKQQKSLMVPGRSDGMKMFSEGFVSTSDIWMKSIGHSDNHQKDEINTACGVLQMQWVFVSLPRKGPL